MYLYTVHNVVRYSFCCLTQTSSAKCPSVNNCFAPYLGTPSWWWGSSGDQALLVCASFHVALLRRSQSQLDALSAALLRACTELFLDLPFMPRASKAFQTDWAGKPLHPTSTLHREDPGRESFLPAQVCQFLVLRPLPFICLIHSFFPRDCQFHEYHHLWDCRPDDYVWAQTCLYNIWEDQLVL